MTLAHLAGLPIEELLALAPAAGAASVALLYRARRATSSITSKVRLDM